MPRNFLLLLFEIPLGDKCSSKYNPAVSVRAIILKVNDAPHLGNIPVFFMKIFIL